MTSKRGGFARGSIGHNFIHHQCLPQNSVVCFFPQLRTLSILRFAEKRAVTIVLASQQKALELKLGWVRARFFQILLNRDSDASPHFNQVFSIGPSPIFRCSLCIILSTFCTDLIHTFVLSILSTSTPYAMITARRMASVKLSQPSSSHGRSQTSRSPTP